ncbi:hypothetical protein TELCIR_14498 [Teladorsagia circumcincta]|uniref:Uncharacterized protein n=1 Tax=Teladorsagia circumcincta TaxID=45464 RepID=A0A2G9U0V4_TELCI|nr:hypothetical protein TELCIR_14498 [Teladorsagia circumcincta]
MTPKRHKSLLIEALAAQAKLCQAVVVGQLLRSDRSCSKKDTNRGPGVTEDAVRKPKANSVRCAMCHRILEKPEDETETKEKQSASLSEESTELPALEKAPQCGGCASKESTEPPFSRDRLQDEILKLSREKIEFLIADQPVPSEKAQTAFFGTSEDRLFFKASAFESNPPGTPKLNIAPTDPNEKRSSIPILTLKRKPLGKDRSAQEVQDRVNHPIRADKTKHSGATGIQ